MALTFEGFSACEQARCVAAFGQNHRIRVSAKILNLDHVEIRDVSTLVMDGQVNLNAGTDGVSRNATLALFDPTHQVGLDTANPAEGSVSPRYLVQIVRGLYVESIGKWVDLPLGTLWITKPSRAGDILTIEAQGKEAIALFPTWQALTFRKGTRKTEALAAIMASIGETRVDIAASAEVFSSDFSMDRTTTPWATIKTISKSMGWNAFYNAAGRFVARPRSANPVYTFTSGAGGTLLSGVQVGYNTEQMYNLVYATGGTPAGAGKPLVAVAVAPLTHPMNVHRNNQRVIFRTDVSDERALTQAAIQAVADNTLALVMAENTSAAFDSLPVWHLEEGDVFGIYDDVAGLLVAAVFTSASFPIRLGAQSNGVTKRVSKPRPLLVPRRVA